MCDNCSTEQASPENTVCYDCELNLNVDNELKISLGAQLDGNLTIASDDSIELNDNSTEDLNSHVSLSQDFNFWQSQFGDLFNLTSLSNCSAASDDPLETPQKIPLIIGNRPPVTKPQPRPHSRTTIRRDNRALTALSLPSIFVTNHRSLFPKFYNFLDEMLEVNMQLGLHSEIWEDKENSHHQHKIEEAFELHGINYISNPRKKRKGGGAAITLIESDFLLARLDVTVPDELEVVWGLVKPKTPSPKFKSIVVCAFYSPPNSRTKSKLIEHIGVNFFKQKALHPNSFFVCGGDKNDLNSKLLLDISPTLHQIVTKPTHKNSTLEIIVTDLGHLYQEPVIRPSVEPDDPNNGVPSDHSIALALPITSSAEPPKRETIFKYIRPFTIEHKSKLADWILHEDWSTLANLKNVSEMVDNFCSLTQSKIEEICPQKRVKITKFDHEITSASIKQLSRQKNREYLKNRNSAKFKKLKKDLKVKLRSEGAKLIDKQMNLMSEKGNNWFRFAKKISSRPGDGNSDSFVLPNHIDSNLTPEQAAEEICSFFSSISQEFKPLDIDTLPERVWRKLNCECCPHPEVHDHEIYKDMLQAKKTDSVPGDIPKDILKEFLPEFTKPISDIIRAALHQHEWPDSFKDEYHLPIKKVPIPITEDDLRGLGLTQFISKRLEMVLINWIWPYIYPHIDPAQLGGVPGCSVVHYLIKMVHFILGKLDSKKPTAVIATLVDFSKAFNRICHNRLLTILADLNIPSCALKLIASYLTNRRMCVRHNGAASGFQQTPGGGPQGSLLIVLFFILLVNDAGKPCKSTPTLQEGYEGPEPHPDHLLPVPLDGEPDQAQSTIQADHPPCMDISKTERLKYVDDLTLLEEVDLNNLEDIPPFIGPLNFHERHGLFLSKDKSILQHLLQDLSKFSSDNLMKINLKKTQTMPFNFSKTRDFIPQLSINGEDNMDVIYQTKLLGLIISSNLSWGDHIDYISKKAAKNFWMLIRFKRLGATPDKLLSIYLLKIRTLLEYATPVFHSSLTIDQSNQLEITQKKALAIVYGKDYTGYERALQLASIERLDTRRDTINLNFAKKCLQNPKHSDMFPLNPNLRPNSRYPKPFLEYKCHTTRFFKSALPSMTRLLNKK